MHQQHLIKGARSLRKLLPATVLSALFLTPLASYAGGYIGVGFGQADSDFDTESVVFLSGPVTDTDESDTSFKVFGGNQVNENIAFEFFYMDLGEASATASGDTYKSEVTGLGVSLLAGGKVGQNFSLFGKVGLMLWDADVTVDVAGVGSGSASDDGTDLLFGVGAKYDFSDKAAVRLEYELIDIDNFDAGTGDFKVLTLGFLFGF